MLDKIEKRIEETYFLDKRELGKVMVVASTAFLIVSVHAALEFQSSAKALEETNKDFKETSAMINSQSFQDSLEALESVRGTEIAPQFIQASESFQSAQGSLENSQQAEKDLREDFETYRWLVLISILGILSGFLTIYI